MKKEELIKKIPGIILSGGESRRMGTPKALLKYGGSNFVAAIADKLAGAGVEDISIVLGGNTEKILPNLKKKNLKTIINADWRGGQITSLRAALRKTDGEALAVIVSLIDHPGVEVSTIRSLLEEFLAGGHDIIIPEYNGRGGHPAVFGRSVFAALLDTSLKDGARGVIRSGSFRVKKLRVNDPFIRQDIDTPEDYRRFGS